MDEPRKIGLDEIIYEKIEKIENKIDAIGNMIYEELVNKKKKYHKLIDAKKVKLKPKEKLKLKPKEKKIKLKEID